MTRGVNKVILLGYVGGEPESKNLPGGSYVVNLSLATTEKWKDKQSGDKQERTEWHRVVFFGRLAEIVNQYVHKGTQLYIEGNLRTRKWTDQKTGTERFSTEIFANDIQLLDNSKSTDFNRTDRKTSSNGVSSFTKERATKESKENASSVYSLPDRNQAKPSEQQKPKAFDYLAENDDIPF